MHCLLMLKECGETKMNGQNAGNLNAYGVILDGEY
jgi:hypothetical protein